MFLRTDKVRSPEVSQKDDDGPHPRQEIGAIRASLRAHVCARYKLPVGQWALYIGPTCQFPLEFARYTREKREVIGAALGM